MRSWFRSGGVRRANVAPGQRKGATMVLIAVVMAVLMMFSGIGIDFGRMYSYVAQLKTLTDAAAHAAAIELRNGGTEPDAQARALALKPQNRVDGLNIAAMDAVDIEPGTWDYSSRSFVTTVWASATAVRATARYNATWSLARIFGVSNRLLTQQSIAALGSIGSSSCMKPWAVPYTNMLQTLGRSPTDTTYDLTPADVEYLSANQVPIKFKISSSSDSQGGATVGSTVISGNYYAVKFGPVQYADGRSGNPDNGANAYRDAIEDTGCDARRSASIGDYLDMENGNMQGPTGRALYDFCGYGNGNPPKAGFTCNRDIQIPIWNGSTSTSGNAWVRIQYIGTFRLTGFNSADEVMGYLTSLDGSGGGGFRPAPGPVKAVALVF